MKSHKVIITETVLLPDWANASIKGGYHRSTPYGPWGKGEDVLKNEMLRFHYNFLLFDTNNPLFFQMCFIRRTNIAHLYPNVINSDAVDFRERRSNVSFDTQCKSVDSLYYSRSCCMHIKHTHTHTHAHTHAHKYTCARAHTHTHKYT